MEKFAVKEIPITRMDCPTCVVTLEKAVKGVSGVKEARGNYLKKSYDEPHELLALQGTISTEGEPRIHLHATVANKEHDAFGGHLMRGKAWMSNEIGLIRLERLISVRSLDPEKNVGILHIKK